MKKVKRTHEERSAAAKLAWKNRRAHASLRSAVAPDKRFALSRAHTITNGHAGYEKLAAELNAAYEQSAAGKGRERHANGLAFDRQPICEIGRTAGPGFATGQAMKKTGEAVGMFTRGDVDKAIFELHGAMVYLAAAVIRMREQLDA